MSKTKRLYLVFEGPEVAENGRTCQDFAEGIRRFAQRVLAFSVPGWELKEERVE